MKKIISYRALMVAFVLMSLSLLLPSLGLAKASKTTKSDTSLKQTIKQDKMDLKQLIHIQTWKTQGGASVYFVQAKELPMVDIAVAFAAGSGYDAKLPGRANMTAQLLAQGAKHLNAQQIAEAFDDVGAVYKTDVGRDMTVLSLRTLSQDKFLNPALNTFHNVLTQATIPEHAFTREKNNILQQLKMQQQSPSTLASNALFTGLYGNHDYGVPVIGTQKSVSRFTRQILVKFYKKYYVQKNATIAIVGDLTVEQAKAVVNKLVRHMRKGRAARRGRIYKRNAVRGKHHIFYPSTQTHIRMGEVTLSRKNKDYLPLYVGASILGGPMGISRLFKIVREKYGLSYSPYSYVQSLRRNGPFIVALQTRNKQADKAVQVTRQTIERFIKKGPSKAELRSIKDYLAGSIPLSLSTNTNILSQVLMIGFYRLPLDYTSTLLIRLQKLTGKQIQTACAKHIKMRNLYIVTVGPGKKRAG